MKNFRSFLNSDSAVKILCIFLAVLFIFAVVFTGFKIANNKKNISESETNIPEEDISSENTTCFYHFGSALDLDVNFEPFECSGYYYSFEQNNIRNQDGMLFSDIKTNAYAGGYHSNALAYNFNGQEKVLFESNAPSVSLSVLAYIDDSLYFSDDNCLYRIALSYDETGDIVDSNLSLAAKGYYVPVKAERNILILWQVDSQFYISLNTTDGETETVDFNRVITDKSDVKSALIAEEKAVKIASEEIKNQKYFRYVTSDREDDVILYPDESYEPELVYNPDIIIEDYEENKYELYPEYVWKIYFTGEFRGKVYVNAETGKISYVSIDFLD